MGNNAWSSSGDTDWNTAGNWADGVPNAGDTALLDATSLIDCTASGAIECDAITVTTGYAAAVLDFNDQAVTTTGDIILGVAPDSEVKMGAGNEVTCGGSFDWSGSEGTITRETSTLVMTGTGVTLKVPYNASPLRSLNKLTIAEGATITVPNTVSYHIMYGVLTINGALSYNATSTLDCYGGFTQGENGSLTGAGTVDWSNAPVSLANPSAITPANLLVRFMVSLPPGTYAPTTLLNVYNFYASDKTFTWQAGTYTFTSPVSIRQYGAGTGTFTISGTNNPTLIFQDDLTVTQTTGTIAFDPVSSNAVQFTGGNDQTVTLLGKNIGKWVVNKSAGTVTMVGDLVTASLTGTDGTLDLDGNDLTVSGDVTMASGFVLGALTDSVVTVAGDFDANGQDLTGGTFDVTGDAVYRGAGTITGCDFDAGSPLVVVDLRAVDGGGNVNVLFPLPDPFPTLPRNTSMTIDDAVLSLPLDDYAASTTVKDAGPNGLDGVAAANTSTKSVAFRGGRALDFDGSTDLVTVAKNDAINFGHGTYDSAFSIAFRIKVSADGIGGVTRGILGRRGVMGLGIWSTGVLTFALYHTGAARRLNIYTTDLFPLGEWVCVVVTYDGSSTIGGLRMWINGEESDCVRHLRGDYVAMQDTDYDTTIGGSFNIALDKNTASSIANVPASLADLRIYDRVLTAVEIRRFYAAMLPADVLADALAEPQQANSGGGFGLGFGNRGQWVPTAASMIDGYAFDLYADEAAPLVTAEPDGDPVVADIEDESTSTQSYATGTSSTQWQLRVAKLSDDPLYASTGFEPTITFESGDESIATVNDDGLTTWVSDGTVEIIATSAATDGSPARRVSILITNETVEFETQDEVTYLGGASGSAREEADDAIDTLVAAGHDTAILTSRDDEEAVYVRNAGCWAASLDLTCCSPWNSYGEALRAGTLISERHIVFANHYPLPVGTTMRFVEADNTVVDRTILGVAQVAGDLSVAVLDEAVPEGIGFAKVLPANHADYFPTGGIRCRVFGLDQEEKALVRDLKNLAYPGTYTGVLCQVPTDATALLCYESIVNHDSGNPLFMVIGGDLVLLCVWAAGGAGAGTAIHAYLEELNAALVALDTAHGYTPDVTATEVDLSGYTDFS